MQEKDGKRGVDVEGEVCETASGEHKDKVDTGLDFFDVDLQR